MSTHTVDRVVDPAFQTEDGVFRAAALVCCLVLTFSYVAVLREVTLTVGGTSNLLRLVVVMIVLGILAGATVRPRIAAGLTLTVAFFAFWYYFSSAGVDLATAFGAVDQIVSDTITLATGLELLRVTEASTWVIAFVPAPVFLSWYLVWQRRYALAVCPGGAALLFVVLTGDASVPVTLVGILAGIGVVAFGELETRGVTLAQLDVLAVLLAVIVLLSLTVTLVPGGTGEPAHLIDGQGQGTLEGAVAASPTESQIAGPVQLSPEVRFTIESESPSYWRTGIYDRFTGDSWVRTEEPEPYGGPIDPPPGDASLVSQTVTVESDVEVIPAAPQPVAVGRSIAPATLVTEQGGFQPAATIQEGEQFSVESAVPEHSNVDLRQAGTVYPPEIEARYLQTPEDTSSAFEERTAEITGDAGTPLDAALAIERYFHDEYDYSLNVDRPSGNVAEEFLFEMDEGYCVYFATTMVQMLRAEDIPARYVTGYTSGQQVSDDEWVVRGLDAHAWVEVYFPGHGWVDFEPTPPSDRSAVHDQRLQDARNVGEAGVDTDQSRDAPIGDDEDDDTGTDDVTLPDNGDDGTDDDPTGNETTANDTDDDGSLDGPDPGQAGGGGGGGGPGFAGDDDDGLVSTLFTPEGALASVVALVGLVAGAHRAGVGPIVSRRVRLHWQGQRTTPAADANRAFSRLELYLATRYRPRRDTETPREYLASLEQTDDLDLRAEQVLQCYERAIYGDGVDRETVDEAIGIVDDLSRACLPLVGRRFR